MTYFHFTHPGHVHSIVADELLRTTESNVGAPPGFGPRVKPAGRNVYKPVIWLLDEGTIDTAGEGLVNGLYPEKRIIRFEVDVPAIKWLGSSWERKMHPEWRRCFLAPVGGVEAAEHWYVWPNPIPSTKWVSVTNMLTGAQAVG